MLGGAAIIAALLIAVFLILALDDLLRRREGTVRLVGVFPRTEGVRPGTPVSLAGRRAGEVIAVSFIEPTADRVGVIALDLRLPAALRPFLRTDSEIRLRRPQPLAPPVVHIVPGTAGAALLQEGDTLWSREEELLRPLRDRVPTLREGAETLLGELETVSARMEDRRTALAPLRERAEALHREIGTLNRLLAEGPASEVLRGEGVAAEVGLLRERLRLLREDLARGSDVWATDSLVRRELRQSLAERLTAARAALYHVDSLASAPGGSLGRFQGDSALVREIAETRAALDSLFAELRTSPQRLFF